MTKQTGYTSDVIEIIFDQVWKYQQRAKKVILVSDSLGLVDFAIGLVNSVSYLPDKRARQKLFGLVKMTSGLVNASFSLPEWQGVKMIFFVPCS